LKRYGNVLVYLYIIELFKQKNRTFTKCINMRNALGDVLSISMSIQRVLCNTIKVLFDLYK